MGIFGESGGHYSAPSLNQSFIHGRKLASGSALLLVPSPKSEMSCLWKSIFLHPFHLNFLISKMDRAPSTLQHSLGQMTEAVNAKRIWQGLEHRGSTVRVHTCPSLPCAVRGPGPKQGWAWPLPQAEPRPLTTPHALSPWPP